jgi:RimJ/RimL family protein N-acetyltransferase
MISPGNKASEGVAAKLGYEATGLSRYKGEEDIMLYARQV